MTQVGILLRVTILITRIINALNASAKHSLAQLNASRKDVSTSAHRLSRFVE